MISRPSSLNTSPIDWEKEFPRIQARARLQEIEHEIHGFRSYVDHARKGYVWYRHNEELAEVLDALVSGELRAVAPSGILIFMPPRHGKSEEVSRLFPGYYLYRKSRHTVGLASYTADLALTLSREARDYFLEFGGAVMKNVRAEGEWRTVKGSTMWATGARGSITGRGFNLGIIDDPYKDEKEAYSTQIRKAVEEWYKSVWYTRREPDAMEIIVQTRWHERDIAGYLLSEEGGKDRGFYVIDLPAIAEKKQITVPAGYTLHKDWREEGKALCPERMDEKILMQIKGVLGNVFWNALYQQRPTVEEGFIFKRSWIKTFKAKDLLTPDNPEGSIRLSYTGIDWDLAYTEKDENSASAFITAGKDSEGKIYIIDLGFAWKEFPDLVKWMSEKKWPHYVEAKATGKSAVQTLKAYRIRADEVKVDGGIDKIARAMLATPACENGMVYVAEHLCETLLDDPEQGITRFPNGPHDDLVDALVQCINRLYHRPKIRFGIA